MIIILVCIIIIILVIIAIYNRGRSEYEINWDNLELTKSDKLENNCFIILNNLCLMNYNKEIIIPWYFAKPKIITDTTQILCLKFELGNYIWLSFSGTYLGPSLLDAFDIRYTKNNSGFTVHKGFYRVYKKRILPMVSKIQAKNKKVIISGYSLGGVLAVLFLCDYIKLSSYNITGSCATSESCITTPSYDITGNSKLIKCITYGTPKFGCKKMYDFFKTYDKLQRIEYEDDMVPKFAARNFYNIGIKKKFNLDNNISGIINNHYRSYLEQYVS